MGFEFCHKPMAIQVSYYSSVATYNINKSEVQYFTIVLWNVVLQYFYSPMGRLDEVGNLGITG